MPPKKKLRVMTTKQSCSSAGRDLKVNKTSAAGKRLQKCKTKPTKLSARINAPKKKGPKMRTVKKETIKRAKINAPKKKGPKMLKIKKERRKKKKKIEVVEAPRWQVAQSTMPTEIERRSRQQHVLNYFEQLEFPSSRAQAEADAAALATINEINNEIMDFSGIEDLDLVHPNHIWS